MVSALFRITSKISALARLGCVRCARKLFDEMPCRDSVAWNAMLTSYTHLGLHREALSLFCDMRLANIRPDHFSFTAVLSSCACLAELPYGAKVHALVIVLGCQSSMPVSNSLIDMYGKCLDTCSASKVFQEMSDCSNEVTWCSLLFAYMNSGQDKIARAVFHQMPQKVLIAWNIMISSHAKYGEIELCLGLLREMQESSCWPDCYTFSSLMSACAESSDFNYGCMVHGFLVKTGWDIASEAKNSVLTFYAKLGCRADAVREFESIGMPTQISWNAIIEAHMRVGDTNEALKEFHRAPGKNVVSWTSMISGYARNGNGEEALQFFVDMMKCLGSPDLFTFGAVLHACSSLAMVGHGKMVHGCIIHHGFQAHAYVGNGVVNMYAKCGEIKESNRAFEDIIDKDVVSWNTMLFGLGMHGLARQALQCFENMIQSGTKPDKVTFMGLLITCSHSGLIEEGQRIFDSMERDYALPREIDHVACMVDMFGRGGQIEEAKAVAKKYHPLANNAKTRSLEALLGACSKSWDSRTGTSIGSQLKTLEARNEMSYVLLSNLYCASGRWKEAEAVRREMLEQGVKKMPGCSWIEVRNKVTAFVAGDLSNPYMQELFTILSCIQQEIRAQSFSVL